MKQLAIMVIAQNISKDVTNRFTSCIEKSKPKTPYDIHMISTSNMDNGFNKSKLLNKGIKKLTPDYEVILQCDIDAIVCPGIIDTSYEYAIEKPICFYNWIYEIDPHNLPQLPENYDDIDWNVVNDHKPLTAGGCWNCMRSKYWIESGGYNEYMVNWGWEDDEFRRRCSRRSEVKFYNHNKFPLIHYNHPPRAKRNMKGNRAADKRAQAEGKDNWL